MSSRIKVLLFSSLYPSSVRPLHGIFVETRLRHLLSSGLIEICVVAPVPWFPFISSRFIEWSKYPKTPLQEIHHNIYVAHPRYLLFPKIGMSIAPFMMALFSLPMILKIHREFNFDLIDAHYYYPDGVAANLIASWFKKPFIVTARGTDLNLIPNFSIPRQLIRWTANKANASIAVCRALSNILNELCINSNKTHILRNGVDLNLFYPIDRVFARNSLGIKSCFSWLLSVGHLIDRKGHDIVIESLVNLPDVHLAIIGEGQLLLQLKSLAFSLGLAERVHFIGSVPQAELAVWYSAADILVLCSSREGWANVLLEAMACGTPVIASNIWGTPEILQNQVAGKLLFERTPSSLAKCIEELLSQYPDRSNVRAYAEGFSWDDTTKGQIFLFKEAILQGFRNLK